MALFSSASMPGRIHCQCQQTRTMCLWPGSTSCVPSKTLLARAYDSNLTRLNGATRMKGVHCTHLLRLDLELDVDG
ncbi:unnamed protein product [Allacma fusca]|uniref:Uncharacterized protein n=1 Tax=Allacma fusca TaxID=39272 RepID=A0A8J2JXH6_9HEXA|nr:unnamed protein product [Allacma fusca]